MTLLSRTLTTIGAILLAHAAYSAHEHSSTAGLTSSLHLPQPFSSSSSPSTTTTYPTTTTPTPTTADTLPLDIVLETLLSVLVLCVGIVLSSAASASANAGSGGLRPVSWAVWAGGLERRGSGVGRVDGKGGKGKGKGRGIEGGMGMEGNPFRALEERRGFLDIRAQRREFADWVRENGVVGGR